jgi:adhesin transport system outer membrane protein
VNLTILKKSFIQNEIKNDIIVTYYKFKEDILKLLHAIPLLVVVTLQAEVLNDVLNNAIKANPDVNKQLRYYESVLQDLEIAKSGNLPTLDYQGSVGRERTKRENSDSINLTHYDNSITLRQNLFNGYETTSEIEQNEARISSAAYSVIDSANRLSYDTIKAYLEVLKENELITLYNENVKNHKDILDKIKERTDAGVGRQSEVQQTQSRLSLAYSNLIVQQNNYQDTLTNYLFNVGRHFDEKSYEIPTLDYKFPSTIDEATKIAVQNNPALKVMRSNILAKKAEHKKSKSGFYPVIDAVVNQDWNDNEDGVEGTKESTDAYLTLRYNFYRGGADEAQELKTLASIQEENEALNRTRRDIIKETRLSYMKYQTYEEQIKYLKVHVKTSKETLDSYIDEYGLGRRDLLAILDAQKEYNTARQTLTRAEYDLLIAKYKLLSSMNTLLDQFKLNITKQVNIDIINDKISKNEDFSPDNICDNPLSQEELNQYGCENTPEINIGYLIQDDVKKEEIKVKAEEKPVTTIVEEPKKEKVVDLKLKNINFLGNSNEISSYSMAKLEESAKQLNNSNFTTLELYSYTDNTGSVERNLIRSKQRAEITKQKLVELGIPEEKIKIFPKGKTNFIADNSTKHGRLLNRRIEFKVVM